MKGKTEPHENHFRNSLMEWATEKGLPDPEKTVDFIIGYHKDMADKEMRNRQMEFDQFVRNIYLGSLN